MTIKKNLTAMLVASSLALGAQAQNLEYETLYYGTNKMFNNKEYIQVGTKYTQIFEGSAVDYMYSVGKNPQELVNYYFIPTRIMYPFNDTKTKAPKNAEVILILGYGKYGSYGNALVPKNKVEK